MVLEVLEVPPARRFSPVRSFLSSSASWPATLTPTTHQNPELMRLATLAALSFCATTLTAQAFTEAQRAELRQIIREEIHSAVKDLHKGGAPMVVAGEPLKTAGTKTFTFHIDGNGGAGKAGEVVELVDVTEEPKAMPPKAVAKKAKGQQALALKVDGGHLTKLGDSMVDLSRGMVLTMDGAHVVKLEGKPMHLELGKLMTGKSLAIAVEGCKLEGSKECCESECANTCVEVAKACEAAAKECCEAAEKCEATEKSECCEGAAKSECCEGAAKAECCDVVIESGDKAAKKAKKAAKKAEKKAKKAAKKALAVPGGAMEFTVVGDALGVDIKKAVETALREIH